MSDAYSNILLTVKIINWLNVAGRNMISPERHILLIRLPVTEHASTIDAPHIRLHTTIPTNVHISDETEYTKYS